MIRLFTELYLDLAVCALLNVKTIDLNTEFSAVMFSNVLAIAVTTSLVVLPIFFFVFFACQPYNWDDSEF